MPKYDSLEKVSGKAQYLIDLKLPGMLYGKILRSKHAHAKIISVDTRRAEELEGVVGVITAKDVPKIKFGFLKDNVALKGERVLSYRDEVAAVAAVDEETARKAVELIEVEYERLDAVFDPLEAMKEEPADSRRDARQCRKDPFSFRAGRPEAIFQRGDVVVVENTFKLQFHTHTALGTMGALASYDSNGTLTVWANTQAPFMYQREMAEAVGIPGDKVRVIQPYIGGSFGRGMDLYPIDVITAFLAIKTGRPIKIQCTREEDTQFLAHEAASHNQAENRRIQRRQASRKTGRGLP